jgi:hypothetical protein
VTFAGAAPTNLSSALTEIITDLTSGVKGGTAAGETVFFNVGGNEYLLITGAGDKTTVTANDTLIQLVGLTHNPAADVFAGGHLSI